MSAPAAISASLVNMRNVGTHKSVALTVHVPEELAAQVIEAFGWPTMANPVSVAVARLDLSGSSDGKTSVSKTEDEGSTPSPGATPAEPKERKAWADLPPSQQAAIRCDEGGFWKFLDKNHDKSVWSPEQAADAVRELCGVFSRRELNDNHKARVIWHQLDREYQEWSGRLARSA